MKKQGIFGLMLVAALIGQNTLEAGPLSRSFARRYVRPFEANFEMLYWKASVTANRPELKEGVYTFEILDSRSGESEDYQVKLTATSLKTDDSRIEGTVFAVESAVDFFDSYAHLALYRHKPSSPYSITFIAGQVKDSNLEVGDLEFQSIISSVDGSFMLGGDHGGIAVEGYLYREGADRVFVPTEVKELASKYLDAIKSGDFQSAMAISDEIDDSKTLNRIQAALSSMGEYKFRTRKYDPKPDDYFISVFTYILENGKSLPLEMNFSKNENGEIQLHDID